MVDVYLAPGHGRRPDGAMDPGASADVGGVTVTEQSESDLICRAAALRLSHYALSVYRQPKGGPNFVGTIDEINDLRPRVALEIHHDWSGAPRGGFGFHGSIEGHLLCAAIQEAYRREGLPTRPNLVNLPGSSKGPAIVRKTTPVTVLWETDRIGAVRDHALYGWAIADGVAKFLGAELEEGDMALSQEDKQWIEDTVYRIVQARDQHWVWLKGEFADELRAALKAVRGGASADQVADELAERLSS